VERLHLLLATVKNLLLASVRPNSSQQNYIVLSGSKGWWCTLLDIRSLPITWKQLIQTAASNLNTNLNKAPCELHTWSSVPDTELIVKRREQV